MSALLLALAAPPPPSTLEAGIDAKLDEVIPAYGVDEWGLAPALMAVSSKFEIPMGIEWVAPTKPERIILSWKTKSVRQILESILKAEPGYRMEVRGEIVGVFYGNATQDRSSFLSVRLSDFSVPNQYVAVALSNLHRAAHNELFHSPPPATVWTHVLLDPGDRPLTADFKDKTIRLILDALTVRSAYQVWVVTFREASGLTRGGFRRTMTIWNDHAITDEYQPVWDRYRWGAPLPPKPAPGGPKDSVGPRVQ